MPVFTIYLNFQCHNMGMLSPVTVVSHRLLITILIVTTADCYTVTPGDKLTQESSSSDLDINIDSLPVRL